MSLLCLKTSKSARSSIQVRLFADRIQRIMKVSNVADFGENLERQLETDIIVEY